MHWKHYTRNSSSRNALLGNKNIRDCVLPHNLDNYQTLSELNWKQKSYPHNKNTILYFIKNENVQIKMNKQESYPK